MLHEEPNDQEIPPHRYLTFIDHTRGGGTPLQEANRDVPLDDDWSDYNGVAFSIDLPEWGRKFSDFWGK